MIYALAVIWLVFWLMDDLGLIDPDGSKNG
jgi:hypothetical protein